MFTGLVTATGTIMAAEAQAGDARLVIEAPDLPRSEFRVGDSIAVNGVCLTAIAVQQTRFEADVSTETLAVTTLGGLAAGDAVNLEPALAVGDRLGGHFVSGHVDCVGTVAAIGTAARSLAISIELPDEFARYAAKKGSICVDGVSLTINAVSGNSFSVNIIPHTADATIIGSYAVGTRVNIEVDLLARYVERLLAADSDGLSIEFLRAHGYA